MFSLQLNIMRMDVAIHVIRRVNHALDQRKRIAWPVHLICYCRKINVWIHATRAISWKLECVRYACTLAHNACLEWIVPSAWKDYSCRVVSAGPLALMGEFYLFVQEELLTNIRFPFTMIEQLLQRSRKLCEMLSELWHL